MYYSIIQLHFLVERYINNYDNSKIYHIINRSFTNVFIRYYYHRFVLCNRYIVHLTKVCSPKQLIFTLTYIIFLILIITENDATHTKDSKDLKILYIYIYNQTFLKIILCFAVFAFGFYFLI